VAPLAQPATNQFGQPPLGEMLYGMQTSIDPDVPDFYTLYGSTPYDMAPYNQSVAQASEGIVPSADSPRASAPASAATGVGFYHGFGPGQPDWGFYSGFTARFTTPR
jgi:hypothetical protein